MTWGLPRRRLDQVRQPAGGAMAPGSPNTFIGRLVVVYGPAGVVSGIFVYAQGTTPGFGNPPIVSITTSATDPYGNAVLQDINVAGAGGSNVQILAGNPAQVLLGTGDILQGTFGKLSTLINGSGPGRAFITQLQSPIATGTSGANALMQLSSEATDLSQPPYAQFVVVDAALNRMTLLVEPKFLSLSNNVAALFQVDAANQRIAAGYPIYAQIVTGATPPSDWTYPALVNGWANNASFGKFGYRLVASPANSVQITGVISATAATAATFGAIPFTPATAGGYALGTNTGNGGATSVANLRWDTSGNLTVNSSAALPNGASFFLGGFVHLNAT